MTRLRALSICLLLLCLLGCHVEFNQEIKCPSFSASGVAVYRWDADSYVVVWPPSYPGDHMERHIINDFQCEVSLTPQAKAKK